MKKIKNKKYQKTSFFKKLLISASLILIFFLAISGYYLARYGVDPLTYLTMAKPTTINCVGDCWYEEKEVKDVKMKDPKSGEEIDNARRQRDLAAAKAAGKTPPPVTFTWNEVDRKDPTIVTQVKETDKNNVEKFTDNKDGTHTVEVIKVDGSTGKNDGQRTTTTTVYDDKGTVLKTSTATTDVYVAPPVTTPTVISTGASCPGANSGIGGGQYAQNGYGLKADKKTHCKTGDECPYRECVKCVDGSWDSTPNVCGEGAATNYITRPDQVVEGTGANNCWSDGTWYADSTSQDGSSFCLNGTWKPKAEYIAEKSKTCGEGGTFNPDQNKCSTGVTTIGGNPVVVPPAAIVAGPKTCPTGQTLVGSSCLTSVDLGRRVRLCEETPGKLFDLATGTCGISKPNSAVVVSNSLINAPVACGLQNNGTQYVDCTADKKQVIRTRFCSASKDHKFDSKGNCISAATKETISSPITDRKDLTTPVATTPVVVAPLGKNAGETCGVGTTSWFCDSKCGGVFTTIEITENSLKKYKQNYCGTAEDVAKIGLSDPYIIVKETAPAPIETTPVIESAPLTKVGLECPKDYLSCSAFCDKNAEGRFASKPVDGKIVCDVPPPLSTEKISIPVTETPGELLGGGRTTADPDHCQFGQGKKEGYLYTCKFENGTTNRAPEGGGCYGQILCETGSTCNHGKCVKDTTILEITDNSSSKNYLPGEKCSNGYSFFGQQLNGKCQLACKGGVFTEIKSGFLGINNEGVCGAKDDPAVIDAARILSKETIFNTTIVGDNKSELTTNNLSECSNSLFSKNLCFKCEVGVVTTINYSSGNKEYCGSKDDVKKSLNK